MKKQNKKTALPAVSPELSIDYSARDSFLKLCRIQETALALEPKPDFTAALKSEELKGKLCGLYPDKKKAALDEEAESYPVITVEFVEKGDTK